MDLLPKINTVDIGRLCGGKIRVVKKGEDLGKADMRAAEAAKVGCLENHKITRILSGAWCLSADASWNVGWNVFAEGSDEEDRSSSLGDMLWNFCSDVIGVCLQKEVKKGTEELSAAKLRFLERKKARGGKWSETIVAETQPERQWFGFL
jgi:hypothetical protein